MEKRGEDLQRRKRKKVNEFPERKDTNGGFDKGGRKWSIGSRRMVGKFANGSANGSIFSHINIFNN